MNYEKPKILNFEQVEDIRKRVDQAKLMERTLRRKHYVADNGILYDEKGNPVLTADEFDRIMDDDDDYEDETENC